MKLKDNYLTSIYILSIYLYIIGFYYLKIRGEDIIFKSLIIISYILCSSLLFFIKHDKKDLICMTILLVFIFISFNTSLIPIVLFTYFSIVYKDEKEFIKKYLYINTFLYLFVVVLYQKGITFLPQIEGIRMIDGKTIMRKSLGFSHPNTSFVYLIPIVLSYIYLRLSKWRILDTVLIYFISFYLYTLTNSRTGFFINILIVIYIYIWKIFGKYLKNFKLIKNIFVNIFFLMTTISFIIGQIYSSNKKMNDLLSLRPQIWSSYIESFFLNPTILIRERLGNVALDNSYLWILILDGIIIWILYCIFFNIYLKKLYFKDEMKIMIIYIAVYSLFENVLTSIYINPLFILGSILLRNKNERGTK